jgi:hypothetical protein
LIRLKEFEAHPNVGIGRPVGLKLAGAITP